MDEHRYVSTRRPLRAGQVAEKALDPSCYGREVLANVKDMRLDLESPQEFVGIGPDKLLFHSKFSREFL